MHFTKRGSGSNIVFLHGWGCDGEVFSPVVSRLKSRHTCYCLDLWGFGKSPNPPEEGWTVENYADRLYLFCVREGIEKTSIVAHSFGGRVAIVFAAKYPQRVDKLLLTSAAGMRKPSFKRWLRVTSHRIAKRFGKYISKRGSADYNSCPEALKNTLVKVVNENLAPYAKKIRCETLLVWGKEDGETPLWMAHRLNRLVDKSSLVVLEGGHFAFLQNVNAFCGIAEAFFGD